MPSPLGWSSQLKKKAFLLSLPFLTGGQCCQSCENPLSTILPGIHSVTKGMAPSVLKNEREKKKKVTEPDMPEYKMVRLRSKKMEMEVGQASAF